MMYIHYCPNCDKIRILSGHKKVCPACDYALRELPVSFETYSKLSPDQRAALQNESRNRLL